MHAPPLIRLTKPGKAFQAGEVETHALAGADPGLLDTPTGGEYLPGGRPAEELPADGATLCTGTHDPRCAGRAGKTIHLFDGRVVGEEAAVAGPGAETLTSKVG